MNKQVKRIVYIAMSAAIICVATGVLKIPTAIGYIHLGDGMIFLATGILGPFGAIAAALGSGFADLMAGYAVYVPATAIIKGLMALVVVGLLQLCRRLPVFARYLIAFVLAELVMVVGYFAFESVLYGVAAAIASVGFNFIQGAAGVIIGFAFLPLAKRLRLAREEDTKLK